MKWIHEFFQPLFHLNQCSEIFFQKIEYFLLKAKPTMYEFKHLMTLRGGMNQIIAENYFSTVFFLVEAIYYNCGSSGSPGKQKVLPT